MDESSVASPSELVPALVTPKGSKSVYWKYFGFKVDTGGKCEDEKRVECRVCAKSIAYSGNTTNLKQHMVHHHPEKLSETSELSTASASWQPTLESFQFRPKAKLASGSQRARDVTDALVKFIVRDVRPLSTIEGAGFQHFCATLEPRYVIPSRKTISTRVKEMYEHVRGVVQTQLDSVSVCALTMDFWSSRNVDSYLGVTAHFITQAWELDSCILQVREVTERHTIVNVSEEISGVLDEWKVGAKLEAITTDNARNIVGAVCHQKLRHIPCFAHTLQLGVRAGLELPSVSSVLSRCCKIVGHFHHSYVAQNELEKS